MNGSRIAACWQISTVLVGDAGNANDTTGFGAVNEEYRIGTYEVTNSQYAEFLNAKAAAIRLCFTARVWEATTVAALCAAVQMAASPIP